MRPFSLTASALITVVGSIALLTAAPSQVDRSTQLFQCGEDEILAEPIPLRWETVVLAGDSRQFAPCPLPGGAEHPANHREVRELDLIQRAGTAPDAVLRRFAAQAAARIGLVEIPLRLLKDPVVEVRREAARGVTVALSTLPLPAVDARDPFAEAATLVRQQLKGEQDHEAAARLSESLGTFKYRTEATRAEIEALLVSLTDSPFPTRVVGAVKGLEAMLRTDARRPPAQATLARLRQIAVVGTGNSETGDRARRLALMALQSARDEDMPTLTAASTHDDWQVRRLVALRVDLARPGYTEIARRLFADGAFQVRYEILQPIARAAARTHDCALLLDRLDDGMPIVAMRAADLMPADCKEQAAIVAKLGALAGTLAPAAPPPMPDSRTGYPLVARPAWHLPVRAIVALARLAPDVARPLISSAAAHGTWQVRAYAATAAGTMGDEAIATALAHDVEPNVRSAALLALQQMKSPALQAAALDSLVSDDYQLVRTAAGLIAAPVDTSRDAVASALLGTLRRLSVANSDTSRDPRMALLQKVPAVLPPARASELLPFADDFDPRIREAALAAYQKLTGAAPAQPVRPWHRYPLQPTVDELSALARIRPDGSMAFVMGSGINLVGRGALQLELLVEDAPVAVARFLALARGGYYNNNLTFHRMAPNFVIQGGSPGANEYAGISRYLRDEIGAPNLRGAVGLSTRGRDTGDGQIYIDLIDVPRLDSDYTIFARVVAGMVFVDGVLEGDRMSIGGK